jgi:hypothetical protein
MKKKSLTLGLLVATFFANAQNVGIGTPTPDTTALLHVHLGTSTTHGFLVTGTVNGSATIPNLGTGSRMMFYPGKAAFRAGYVDGTHWDNANVGAFSTAMGINTIASGDFSTAIGFITTASAYSSIAIGSVAQANSVYSLAIGESVTANSWNSISLGRQNDPIVTTPTIGWILNEPLLIVGNGTGSTDKKNALAIAKNGNIYVDASNKNDGTLSGNTLLFGAFNGAGEGIASKRTATGNQNGLDFYTAAANRMSITNGGNVGIGTTTPNAPLGFPPLLGKKITLYPGATGDVGMAVQGNLLQIYSDNPNADIAFGYDQGGTMTERMRIKANGNVGIGTTSPQKNLSVQNGMNIDQADGNTGSPFNAITFGNSSGEGIGSKRNAGGNQWGLDFYTNSINRMSITNGGNVGIGITTPVNTLDVTGNTVNAGNFVNTSSISGYVGVQASCNNTANNGYGIIGYGGYAGVLGQASLPGTGNRYGLIGLAAGGGTSAYGIYGSASGGATSVYSGYFAGDVYCNGNYFGSDRKLKNDIKPLSDALSIINQLKPSVYTFKTNEYKQMNLPEGLQYGLIADEVQQVVPGAVKKAVQPAEYENHDGHTGKKLSNEVEFNAVNYTEMIPILIAAMKEQQVMIEDLKMKNQKIDQQQQQINELLKEIQLIKEKLR